MPEIRNPHCLRATTQNLIIATARLGIIANFTSPELKTVGLEDCKQILLLGDKVITLSTLGTVYCQDEETGISDIAFIYSLANLLITSSKTGLLTFYSREMRKIWSSELNGFVISIAHQDQIVIVTCRGQVTLFKFNSASVHDILTNESILLESDDIPAVCPAFNSDGTILAFAKTNWIYTINLNTRHTSYIEVDPCLVTSIIWVVDRIRVYTLASNIYEIRVSTSLQEDGALDTIMTLEKDLTIPYTNFLEKTWKIHFPPEPKFSTFAASTSAHGLYDFVIFGAGTLRFCNTRTS